MHQPVAPGEIISPQIRQAQQPYRQPCIVLTDPASDTKKCGLPSGEHTVLDLPLCDTCYEAIRL